MSQKQLLLSTVLLASILLSACNSIKTTTSQISTPTQPAETTSQISLAPTTGDISKAADVSPSISTSAKTTQIELILDDSGSMAELVGGKAKIDVAKESLNKIVDELKTKDNLNVALRIYGHQNKECTNSVLEVPMSKIDSDLIKSKIKDLKPLGYTPIYYSLTQSANDFDKNISGDKIVVLVTDGLESCNGDPCAAAKALKAGGVVDKMQVVGFGLKKTELDTLQCIVDPFKGQVVGAANSTEFLAAMQQIVNQATSKPNLNITVTGADGKPIQAKDICVYPQGQTDKETVCAGMYTSDYGFTLKPGVYDIKVTNGNTSAETWLKNVEIKTEGIVNKIVSFAEGSLKVSIVDANGNSTQASDLCVYPQGQTDKETACAGMFTADYEFKLPPGIYDLKVSNYNNDGDKWTKNIEVKASQTVTQSITL